MVTKKKKTTQLGLRIDDSLLEKIEKMAEYESIDKMSWIRRALATFLNGEEEAAIDEAIEDYIYLRIDEAQLIKAAKFKEVPLDVRKAREDCLKYIIQKKKDEAR